MNKYDYLILIENKPKTKDICSCRYNPDTKKWDVTYNTSRGKVYSYYYNKVTKLKEYEEIDNNTVCIYIERPRPRRF